MIVFKLLFWISIFLLAYTYILYPMLLKALSRGIQRKRDFYLSTDELPLVSILIAAHNEEKVIAGKMDSILAGNYKGKIEILIGSDCSTDDTDKILAEYALKVPSLKVIHFSTRQGKGNIINRLVSIAKGEILLLTDANVFFTENTIFNLARHFKMPEIGLVDANMHHRGKVSGGISLPESLYISMEVKLKNREGELWGSMMGPFGGCFAIRKDLYHEIPGSFLADDFYLNMQVLKQGKKSVNDLEALVFEDITCELSEEFRRRVRISTGNFQNLFRFGSMLFPPWKKVAFSFLSHKVLRWLGPVFLIFIFTSNIFLFQHSTFYSIALFVQVGLMAMPLIDYLLEKCRIQIIILRFIAHFYSMNAALLLGLVKYTKGVKSNVWEPTKRNQQEAQYH
jgi:cellulose synthase/poly-beta-1,6-N-acetylglucosamine synthase-like glycosyltransferase